MARRVLKLTEEDLRSFLEPALQSAGYLTEEQKIEGFVYSTRKIKKGGDFYKDALPPDTTETEFEEVKFIRVMAK